MTDRKSSRRTFLLGAGALAGTGLLASCAPAAAPPATGQPASPAAPSPTTARVKVGKWGSLVGDTHPGNIADRALADLIKKKTSGSVEFQVFPSGQLGGEREVAEGMLIGSVQAQALNIAILGNWAPDGLVFDMPFIFRDNPHAFKVVSGPIGQEVADKYVSKGFRIVGYRLSGVRHPISKFPVNVPADVKGKKMRVIQSPLHVGLWSLLGAIPTPLPPAEIYNATQSGVIDLFDNSKNAWWEQKFYEVAPYLTDLGHIYAIGAITISEKFWSELTPAEQTAIREAVVELAPTDWARTEKDDVESVRKAVEKGAKVIQPDKGPWRNAMAPFWDEWGPKVGGRNMIDRVVNAS